jgi:CRP/FNR family cyclic AMP-dependent transcriptional regulator
MQEHLIEKCKLKQMESDIELLKQAPLFQSMQVDELQALSEIVTVRHFKSGQTLFQYGEPGDTMYFVRSGTVKFTTRNHAGEEVVLEEVGEGNFFGEVALLDGGARTATAIATSEMTALELDSACLERFLLAHPHAVMELLKGMATRLRRSGAYFRQTATRNANIVAEEKTTPTDILIARIAKFCGSVRFLVWNAIFCISWIGFNQEAGNHAVDRFPYNFLAMLVGVEAVFFSGIVLINQNRESSRQFDRNEIEYQANLTAEEEIGHLHEKIDELRADLLRHRKEMATLARHNVDEEDGDVFTKIR